MNFKPILFSTAMVRAIQEGRKTMTRRMTGLDKLNENPSNWQKVTPDVYTISNEEDNDPWSYCDFQTLSGEYMACPRFPYGQVGDVLWVRETAFESYKGDKFFYKADYNERFKADQKWKPSIHMRKAACRIFLEITDIRIERLQDITQEDAIAEGIMKTDSGDSDIPGIWYKDYISDCSGYGHPDHDFPIVSSPVESFCTLWRSINGIESWDANPWVWVVSLKRIDRPNNFLIPNK
jgi:hypothetical protein